MIKVDYAKTKVRTCNGIAIYEFLPTKVHGHEYIDDCNCKGCVNYRRGCRKQKVCKMAGFRDTIRKWDYIDDLPIGI